MKMTINVTDLLVAKTRRGKTEKTSPGSKAVRLQHPPLLCK